MDRKNLATGARLLGVGAILMALIAATGAPWTDAGRATAQAEEPPGAAPAKAPPAAKPAAKPRQPIVERQDDWYGIYLEGNKAGWAHITSGQVERDGKTLVRSHYLLTLNMKAMGETKTMQMEEEQLYEAKPPHRFLTGWHVQRQGAFSQRVEITEREGAFAAEITAGGQKRSMKLDEAPISFLEAMKPYHWFKQKRAAGSKLTYRSFDLGELEFDDDELTVTEVVNTVVDGVPLTYYVAKHSSKRDGPTGTMRVDEKGRLLSMEMMGSLEVRLESETVAKQPGRPVDVFVSRVARIDQPLGEQADVIEMVVEVRGNGIEHIRDGPRQRSTYDAEKKVLTLKLGAAHGPKVKATEEEIRKALAEDTEHPIRDARIVALAKQAVGDAKTPREKVNRLVAFVDTYIEDSYSAEPLSVIDILNIRKGDCTEHSALFATLARASSIPARQVGGLMYLGDEIRIAGAYGFGGHAWNEVVLDGIWVPVDATWGQTEIDATHIRQAADDTNRAASFALGAARLKLISIKRR